jgi:hypothetical protein
MKLVLLPGVYRKLMTKGGSFSIMGGGRRKRRVPGVCNNRAGEIRYVTPEKYGEFWP